MDTYSSGAASLFSCIARQPQTVCDWCGQPGQDLQDVEAFLIPASHNRCAAEARQAARSLCVCFKFQGDNDDCPIHGGK